MKGCGQSIPRVAPEEAAVPSMGEKEEENWEEDEKTETKWSVGIDRRRNCTSQRVRLAMNGKELWKVENGGQGEGKGRVGLLRGRQVEQGIAGTERFSPIEGD